MQEAKFLIEIQDLLQLESNLLPSAKLNEIPGWDSLMLLTIISLAESEFNSSIDIEELQQAINLHDIYEIIRKNKT